MKMFIKKLLETIRSKLKKRDNIELWRELEFRPRKLSKAGVDL